MKQMFYSALEAVEAVHAARRNSLLSLRDIEVEKIKHANWSPGKTSGEVDYLFRKKFPGLEERALDVVRRDYVGVPEEFLMSIPVTSFRDVGMRQAERLDERSLSGAVLLGLMLNPQEDRLLYEGGDVSYIQSPFSIEGKVGVVYILPKAKAKERELREVFSKYEPAFLKVKEKRVRTR